MWVDDKITNEFVKGDITSQAYKTYLRSQMEREREKGVVTPISKAIGNDVSFQQKASSLLDLIVNGNFYADNWERQFIRDNVDNSTPSEAQINRMDRMWRKAKEREAGKDTA